mmetsp:Transcript_35605/g.91547  ORF Transcript_35605/g.91547 Transcript_35605/m.91547 type:complete len:414 (+) Transcript_35605:781-2022(+)
MIAANRAVAPRAGKQASSSASVLAPQSTSACVASARPANAAAIRGVQPFMMPPVTFASTSALKPTSAWMVSAWPETAAARRGEAPCRNQPCIFAPMSARRSMRSSTTSSWPCKPAAVSAVAPLSEPCVSLASTSHRSSSRRSTASRWPRAAAACSTLAEFRVPALMVSSGFARERSKVCIISTRPVAAAHTRAWAPTASPSTRRSFTSARNPISTLTMWVCLLSAATCSGARYGSVRIGPSVALSSKSRRTAASRPQPAATKSGESPDGQLFTSARRRTSSEIVPAWPAHEAARCRGSPTYRSRPERPRTCETAVFHGPVACCVVARRFAPSARAGASTSTCPDLAAMCMGVSPKWFVALMFAFAPTRKYSASSEPAVAAKWAAVLPSRSRPSSCAPHVSRYPKSSTLPDCAA